VTATAALRGAQLPMRQIAARGGCVSGPLAGLLVVDLTWYLAGPYATMVLADLGAEVLKIEQPRGGDPVRGNGPYWNADQRYSSYFMSVNRGKQSLVLDLKQERGRDLLRDLAARADVLVENFLPGAMERLGLDYAALAERNPRLVYASCSGFGQTGPYARRPALDVIIQAMAGTMSITGDADGEPMRAGMSVGDLSGALFTTIGILAALQERERSGCGQRVDVALLDAQVALLENAFARYFATGEVPERQGTSHPLITPFQSFATADGYLVVAASPQAHWRGLCDVLERPDLKDDPRFAERADRTRHRAALIALLAPIFRGRTTAEWVERLVAAGVPCGPVNAIDTVADDPHLAARGMFVDLDVPGLGTAHTVNSPLHLDRTPVAPAGPPPALGADTDRALAAHLGLDAATLAALRAHGIIG
jgi:CoA:oxalate CoA-transferase